MAAVDVLLLNAETEFRSGNFEKAVECYTQALSMVKENNKAGILHLRSKCYFEMRDYPMALRDAEELIRVNSDNAAGYNIGAECLSKLQRFEEAYGMFQTSLQLDSDNTSTINNLQNMKQVMLDQYEAMDGLTNGYNAVDLCGQGAYPGDNNLILQERKKVSEWKLIDSVNDIYKSDAFSLKYENGDLINPKNIECSKENVRRDPLDASNWETLIFALYNDKKLQEAYQYTEGIPIHVRNSNIWILGGKIRRDLGLPVMAEFWFRNATKCSKGKDTEGAILFQQVRVKRMYEPLTSGTSIEVVFDQHGRTIKSKDKVQDKSILFKDSPVVLSQTVDTQHVLACSHCAKCLSTAEDVFGVHLLKENPDLKRLTMKHWPKRNIVKCKKCDFEIYCSDACREDAWGSYHKIICTSVNSEMWKLYDVCTKHKSAVKGNNPGLEGTWNASFSPMLLARMWAMIICSAAKHAQNRECSAPGNEDYAEAKTIFRRFIAYGSGSYAKIIPKMVEIMKEIFSSVPKDLQYEITEKEFDARYFQAACNVQAFSDSDHPLYEFRRKLKGKPVWNKIQSFVNFEPAEAIFAGLFPVHACLNHSCMNNVSVIDGITDGKPGVHVKANKPIAAGEELFTTYIDTRLSRRNRRTWLFRAYNFWCKCPRCEFEGDDSSTCTECEKKTAEKKGFPVCSRCHKAWYCSTNCQKKAWKKGHKQICSSA